MAYAMVTNPRFFELIGHAIEYDRLATHDAQMLVWAAHEINRANGQPCASTVAAVQQLRLRVNDGKLTMEELEICTALLDAVEDAGGITDLPGLIATVTPAVKKIGFNDAVEQTIQSLGQGDSDATEAAERFDKLAALGKARVSMGTPMLFTREAVMAAAISTIRDPMPLGIDELDIALGGGIERASLCCFLGNPGDGKSLILCHIAAEAIWGGHSVAYVTAELSEEAIQQRIYANLFGLTAHEMSDDPDEVVRRHGLLAGVLPNSVGSLRTFYATPKMGTVGGIKSWLDALDRDFGEHPLVLIVDYADKLAAKSGGEPKSSYIEQGAVYEQLRQLVIDRDGWGFTASQTTGRQGRKKKLDIEDIADSMEKARIVDTLVAIVRSEEDTQNGTVRFRMPKRRNNVAHGEVGPLTMDPERGRMVVLSRPHTPW